MANYSIIPPEFAELPLQDKILILLVWIVATIIFAMFSADSYIFPTFLGIVFGIVIGLMIGWATLILVSTR